MAKKSSKKSSRAGTTATETTGKGSPKAPAVAEEPGSDAPVTAGAEGFSEEAEGEALHGGQGIDVPPLPESAYPPGSIPLPGDGWEFDEATDEWVHECGFRIPHVAVLSDARDGGFTEEQIDRGDTRFTRHDCADFDDPGAYEVLRAESLALHGSRIANPPLPSASEMEDNGLGRALASGGVDFNEVPDDGQAGLPPMEADNGRAWDKPPADPPLLIPPDAGRRFEAEDENGDRYTLDPGTFEDPARATASWHRGDLVPLDRNGDPVPQGARVCLPGRGSRAGKATRYTAAGLVVVELDGPIRHPVTNAIQHELEVDPGECILEGQ